MKVLLEDLFSVSLAMEYVKLGSPEKYLATAAWVSSTPGGAMVRT